MVSMLPGRLAYVTQMECSIEAFNSSGLVMSPPAVSQRKSPSSLLLLSAQTRRHAASHEIQVPSPLFEAADVDTFARREANLGLHMLFFVCIPPQPQARSWSQS